MNMTPEQAAGMRAACLMELAQEHKATMPLLEACPEDKLGWKPADNVMPFGEHFHHIYGAGVWLASIGAGSEAPPQKHEVPSDKAGLKADCEAHHAKTVEIFEALSPEELATPREFKGMGSSPGVVYLRWHLSHLIHHRGQVQLYLRLMGAKCPSIYGPTADVSFEELVASAK